MSGWLTQAKAQVDKIGEAIAEELAKMKPGREVKVNVGFVSQKDFDASHKPDAGHLDFQSLTDDCAPLTAMIKEVKASGGGDTCEDVHGALKLASSMRMAWSRSNRIIIHFLDAPPHGESYHDLGAGSDHHYKTTDNKLTDTLRYMARERMHYTMVQCVTEGAHTLDKFAKVCEKVYSENAAAQGGQAGIIPKFTPLNIKTSDHKQFFELVIASSMRSMNPAMPSKTFDQCNSDAVARLASIPEDP